MTMGYWERVAYGVGIAVAASVAILIVLAYISKDAAFAFLYDFYWAPIFVVGFFTAPLVRRIVRKDKKGP